MQQIIENAWENRSEIRSSNNKEEVLNAVNSVLNDLNLGKIRVATRESVGKWTVHQWIKKAVLLSFILKDNKLVKAGDLNYFDKVPLKFSGMSEEEIASFGVRIVPPAVVRKGA